MDVANVLAYYDMATITAIKSLTIQSSGACTIQEPTLEWNT
jgi:hypothetical protein